MIISKTESVFKLGYELLPDLWIVARRGFPKMVIMAEFTGDSEDGIDESMKGLEAALRGIQRRRSQDEKQGGVREILDH